MKKFFRPEIHKNSFELFSSAHVTTLGVMALLAILLFVFRRRLRAPGWNEGVRYILAAILILSQISYQIWVIVFGKWTLRSSLPIQLSDLAVLFAAIMLITKSRALFGLLYYAGIGSSLQAVLTPDLGSYSFPHFYYIEFFTAHGGMILACLFMIAVHDYQPQYGTLWFTFLIVNVYGLCILAFDWLADANYLYLMHKPNGSLLNFLGRWPWYLLSLEWVSLVEFHLLYWIFRIMKRAAGISPRLNKVH